MGQKPKQIFTFWFELGEGEGTFHSLILHYISKLNHQETWDFKDFILEQLKQVLKYMCAAKGLKAWDLLDIA